jgi:methylglutamate dehydrogenase subunit C
MAAPDNEQPCRLAQGGLIDRAIQLKFLFDGKAYRGHPGDTLASALLANGVHLVGRSFKYHRPRGILTAGSEEPNALVELREGGRLEPNTRATMVELFDGLSARSQNRWPSLGFDVMAVNSLLSPFLAAGFYYKTFMWPSAFWEKVYEPVIRRAAGLGRASRLPDPDAYEKAWAHCDVLVVGAGPTGLMAALAAGRAGARVILADEDFKLGGRLLAERLTLEDTPAADWVEHVLEELASMPNVRLMPRTTVFGVYDQRTYGAVEHACDHTRTPPPYTARQKLWRIVAKRCVLAAGAIERPIAFANNDLPGVMLAGATRTYVTRFGVIPGKRAVVFTSCDDGWRTADALAAAGARVTVVDPRDGPQPDGLVRDYEVIRGVVVRGLGGRRIEGIEVRCIKGNVRKLACDLLAVSNGWNPSVNLTCHQGAKPVWRPALHAFTAETLPPGMAVGGAAAGHFSTREAFSDGVRLGAEAAIAAGSETPSSVVLPSVMPEDSARVSPVWSVTGGKGKAFVDFQNDVTASDIALAAREGYRSVEHLKRYTTLGMATDQGKTANVTALAIMGELTGRAIPEVGTTVFRPPYAPVSFGVLAGHGRGKTFRPTRLTPTHGWAVEHGAVFTEAGLWLRAHYFRQPGETDWKQSVAREVRTVRSAAGICDVTTLGKIDVQGRDAAVFLDHVYANMISTLAVGKVRYAVMLREDGFVMDDGTVCRLGEEHFLATTTTANAARVLAHLDFCRQVLWPELDVAIVPVTEGWAQISIAGPRSRDVLQNTVDTGCDVSNEALPYMGYTQVAVGGIPCRLFRVSFSGELAFEIAVSAEYGDALARALMQAGSEFGICPYGTEALGVMRIEKGHAAGPELDGRTTLSDLGLTKLGSRKKDYIGRTMAARAALNDASRFGLVGLIPADKSMMLAAGAHLVAPGSAARAENDEGHVTSAAHSPTLGHDVALALLQGGRARIGAEIRAVDQLRGTDVLCQVVAPVFVDPEGEKLRG